MFKFNEDFKNWSVCRGYTA